MLNRRLLAAVLLVGSVVLAACGDGDPSQTATNGPTTTTKPSSSDRPTTTKPSSSAAAAATVHIEDDAFDPTTVEIKAGEAVVWRWEGKNPHNVSGPGFKSKIQSSGSFTETFDDAGDFDYRCDVHPTMLGRVVVS